MINKIDDNINYQEFINDILIAEQNKSLVCFIGAGVSISQGYPDWNKYIKQYINYWSFNLKEIVKNEKTKLNKVESADIMFIENLEKMTIEKKRKVDLVNHVIEKYCECDSMEDSNSIYKENVLNFEKFIFSDTEPITQQNKILKNLVSLNTSFITTNYDSQIEKSHRYEFEKDIISVSDTSAIPDRLLYDSVIHLHGTPDSNPEFFISSGKSYSSMYFKNQKENVELMKKIFNKKIKCVVLFIGCSMEEDEILSLFDFKSPQIKKYALMQYTSNSGINEVNKSTNNYISDFYQKNHDINIMWYGKTYDDLPFSVEKMVEDVINLKKPDRIEFERLREQINTLDEYTFTKTIDRIIEENEYYMLDSYYEELVLNYSDERIEAVKLVVKSRLFTDQIVATANLFNNLWTLVSTCFGKLDTDEQKIVLKNIENLKSFSVSNEKNVIEICKNYTVDFSDLKKYEFYQKYLKSIIQSDTLFESLGDNFLNCCWLINNVPGQFYLDDDMINFTFNEVLLDELLKKLDANLGLMLHSSDYLEDTQFFGSLKKIILSDRLFYGESKIFPECFYANKLIQRLYINIAIDYDISETILETIRINIDWDYKNYGNELNLLNKRLGWNDTIPADFFIDSIGEVQIASLEEFPFFVISNFNDINYKDEFIGLLKETTTKETELKNGVFYQEISIEGQSRELIEKFTDQELINENPENYYKFLDAIIESDEIRTTYFKTIVEILITNFEKKVIDEDIINIFLQKNDFNNWNQFGYDLTQLFITVLKNSEKLSYDNIIFDILFNKISVENVLGIQKTEIDTIYLDLTAYLNSELGWYYNVIDVIKHEYPSVFNQFSDQFIEKIENLENPYKEYIIGKYYLYFEENKADAINQITLNMFKGFSHHNKLVLNDTQRIEVFKNISKEILVSEIDDEFLIDNIILIMFKALTPYEIEATSFNNDNFSRQILKRMIYHYSYLEQYQCPNMSDWIVWFIMNNNMIEAFVRQLLFYWSELSIEKTEVLVKLFDKKVENISVKLSGVNFSYFRRLDKMSYEQIGILNKFLTIIVEKNLVNLDARFIKGLDMVLSKLLDCDKSIPIQDILNKYEPYMVKKDYDSLIKKYSENL